MEPVSYLIAIISTQKNVEHTLAIMNNVRSGHAIHGFSRDAVNTDLWIVPGRGKSKEELIGQLKAISAIHQVAVVALSHPVQLNELTEVRQLFAGVGWDASGVANDALATFINARIQGQYNFYIDYDLREKPPVRIQIKLLEEHPHFSPDWHKPAAATGEQHPDRELTLDDIEMCTVELKGTVSAPPPPPPPPKNG